jgi:hypothetical protein
LTSPSHLSPRQAAKRLDRARKELEVVGDARSVAIDVTREQPDFIFKRWDGNDWLEEEPALNRAPDRWIDQGLSWSVPELATGVQSVEQQVRQRLSLESQLFAAGAAVWISCVAIALAAAAAVIALLQWQFPST